MSGTTAILALAACFSSGGCADALVDAPPDDTATEAVDAAWQVIHDVYPYLSFKKINWDSLRTVYHARAALAHGDESFQVLFDMLHELRDGHARLAYAGTAGVRTYLTPREVRDADAFDPQLVWKRAGGQLHQTGEGNIEYGVLDGGTGYIRITTFVDGSWTEAFDAALAELRATHGLILDLRHNMGGSDLVGMRFIRRFLSAPLENLHSYYRGTLQRGSPLYPAGPFQYTAPVVVLINGTCFSACEDVAEIMNQVPSFTLVGDTTAGASGAPQHYRLPGGKDINICTVDIRRYDDQPIEWNGVIPDVRVAQTAEDVRQGFDRQLEYALGMLRTAQ